MQIDKEGITQLDRVTRLKLINSISGIKSANLIGTISDFGQTNLAIFSSIVHLGSNPALLGFMLRPTGEVPRHTYENILQNSFYTINHVKTSFIKKAHYTSAKLPRETSEFKRCGLTEEYLEGFKAPFVKESEIKIGMKHKETIEIKCNGTFLVIGTIENISIPDEFLIQGNLDLSLSKSVGISGLNSYYELNKLDEFPYVRLDEIPEFQSN